MKLKVLLPTGVLVDDQISKVSVEAADGALTLLPAHVDFVTALAPGVLAYEPTAGAEAFVAHGEGMLTKVGPDVLVSVRKGVRGTQLGSLREQVEQEFADANEQEDAARAALSKIEATFVHRFIEFEHGA